MHTDSFCSLRLTQHMESVRIILNCSDQCSLESSFYSNHCTDLFNKLVIQYCNLSECITSEISNITMDKPITVEIETHITREDSQTSAPTTTVTETMERNVTQDISCITNPLSSREVKAVIGALVGLVVVLFVTTILPWMWIWWRLKWKGRWKRNKQQAR